MEKLKIIFLVINFLLVINLPVFANINNLNEFKISEQISQEIITNDKKILAITDISNETGNSSLDYFKGILPNSLTTSLVPKLGNSVAIVERGKFTSVLKEIGIAQSGYIDINTAKKIGNALGASQIIVGELIKISELYRLNIRIIDVNNSVVLSAFSEETGTENDILKMVDKISDKITSTLIGKTIQKEDNATWITSLFIPGLGQILLGEVNRGILFMIGELPLIALTLERTRFGQSDGLVWIYFVATSIIHIWNVTDAYSIADQKSKLISETNASFLVNREDNIKFTLCSLNF